MRDLFKLATAVAFSIVSIWVPWSGLAPMARAESPAGARDSSTMIQIQPALASSGVQMSWGQCPCFRWTVQLQGLGGGIETRQFLVSSDALFKMREDMNPGFQRWQKRLFTLGAAEALWKGGRVGLGFRGVAFGEDRDRGYTDLIRSGFYVLVNALLTDSLRFDIRSAYDFERMRVNQGPELHRGVFDQSAELRWRTRRWSGKVSGHVGFDDGKGRPDAGTRAGGEASARLRVLSLGDFQAGLGMNAAFEHDPFLKAVGFTRETNILTVGLSMDLTYVGGDQALLRQ